MVQTSSYVPSTLKVTLVKKKKNDDSSNLLIKKERGKMKWKKKKGDIKNDIHKKEKKREKEPQDWCSSSRPLLLSLWLMVHTH
jgi:hypothetical protein